MSARERQSTVVVTGYGAYTPRGDVGEACGALEAGTSALAARPLGGVAGLPAAAVGVARDPEPSEFTPDRKLVKYMSFESAMAVVAAGRALRHAGLLADERRAAMGLYVATGLIAFDLSSIGALMDASRAADGGLDLVRLGRDGMRLCHPLLPFKMLLNMPLAMVSVALGIRGPSLAVYPGGGEGGACFEAAVRAIRNGRLSRALVGGAVRGSALLPSCTQMRLGLVAGVPEAAQPFTPGHAGWALADAAAFVVLESRGAAEERGAAPRAEITAASVGRSLSPDDAASRDRLRRRLWADACGPAAPELLLASGSLGSGDDAALGATARALWPAVTPRLASFDGTVGFCGPASAALHVAGAAEIFTAGSAPSRALVSVGDGDGGQAAVALLGPDAAERA